MNPPPKKPPRAVLRLSRMRARVVILMAFVVALLAGCGDSGNSTPVACLEGPEAYERALSAAPDEALLVAVSINASPTRVRSPLDWLRARRSVDRDRHEAQRRSAGGAGRRG